MNKIMRGITGGLASILVAATPNKSLIEKDFIQENLKEEKREKLETFLTCPGAFSLEETLKNVGLIWTVKNKKEKPVCHGIQINGGYVISAQHCFTNDEIDGLIIYRDGSLVFANKIISSPTNDIALLWSSELTEETHEEEKICLIPNELEALQRVGYASLSSDWYYQQFRARNHNHLLRMNQNIDLIIGEATGRKIFDLNRRSILYTADLPALSGMSGSGVLAEMNGKWYYGGVLIGGIDNESISQFIPGKGIVGKYYGNNSAILNSGSIREFITSYIMQGKIGNQND